ncbi:MAG: MFS transporter [Candidatus Dormibacteria bacterium]
MQLHGSRSTSRTNAFWLVALIFAAAMLGTTLPTPLYVIWQGQWHFTSGVVTAIYATYAAGVLAALLLAGQVSDVAGRRPVLGVALGLSGLSTIVFVLAPGVGLLFAGRLFSGLAAGLVTGTATATLTDLAPSSRRRWASLVATAVNLGGLGLGPLAAGLLSQYAPDPTVLVFEVYLAVLATAALALLLVPETVADRRRPGLSFGGLGIPSASRGAFVAAGVAGFAAFSLLGLFSALAPSFLGTVLHQKSHFVAGAVVFLMFAAATVTQPLVSRVSGRTAVRVGLGLFLLALALILTALSEAAMSLFLAGTALGGIAGGAVFAGSLATANQLAEPGRRGRAISTYFVFAYVGLTVPVVGVGVTSGYLGDFGAVLAFSILLTILCAVATALT